MRKRRERVYKAISAGIVAAFYAVLSTNADPSMWVVALIGLALYEANLILIREIHQAIREYRSGGESPDIYDLRRWAGNDMRKRGYGA